MKRKSQKMYHHELLVRDAFINQHLTIMLLLVPAGKKLKTPYITIRKSDQKKLRNF
jgi:hypothetical protein